MDDDEQRALRLNQLRAAALRQAESNSVMQRIDLMSAAWGWSAAEQAAAVHRHVDELAAYRHRDLEPDGSMLALASDFERIQFGLWATRPFSDYARWWRRHWAENSPIGAQSPLAAMIATIGARHLLHAHFDAMLSGDFT